jgi:hypothetical protein
MEALGASHHYSLQEIADPYADHDALCLEENTKLFVRLSVKGSLVWEGFLLSSLHCSNGTAYLEFSPNHEGGLCADEMVVLRFAKSKTKPRVVTGIHIRYMSD